MFIPFDNEDIGKELSKLGGIRGNSTVKGSNDRDRWQLTRDLTAEEMEECKNNEYEFRREETREESELTKSTVDKEKMEEKLKTNDKEKLNEPLLEKSFSELDDISKYQNTKSINKGHGKLTALTKNEVVDAINRYKKGVEEEQSKRWEEKEKIPYQRYILSLILSEKNESSTSKSLTLKERKFLKLEEVLPKVEKLKNIFKEFGEVMA
ncbi:hypothetical protein RhiirA1_478848 [Rhizophagus irregularis]|uniref:Uncharacterized protein n=1 Tax=Rhizophagus irregularis TaxID=588596 RepID=A0A2N0QRH6_9GLOM|nr:hypothetical protein RhiirA1_478848 [Rhizophagus irregularis]